MLKKIIAIVSGTLLFIQCKEEINPFLRLHDKEIVKNAELFHDIKLNSKQEAFAAIRSWKDSS